MRNIERIDIFTKYLEDRKNQEKLEKYFKEEIGFPINLEKLNFKEINKFWKMNPDLRFTQVLVTLNEVPNYQGMWYHLEDDELLVEAKICEYRDIVFWTSTQDYKGKIAKRAIKNLIKDLDEEHIKNILKTQHHLSPRMIKIFERELRLRRYE